MIHKDYWDRIKFYIPGHDDPQDHHFRDNMLIIREICKEAVAEVDGECNHTFGSHSDLCTKCGADSLPNTEWMWYAMFVIIIGALLSKLL